MNNQMMAAVLYGKENLQVEPVAVPTIDTGDILVRVKVALTCGTDVKVFRRGYHARMIVPRVHLERLRCRSLPALLLLRTGDRFVLMRSRSEGLSNR